MSKSSCPGGGLYVVEGEVSLLMTAMRRGVRWSSHSHQLWDIIFQDEDQDILMKGLSTLKEALSDSKNLSQLEPGVFLTPFLEIIRSEETTGPVTSLALAAINKMISYGLIDHEHPAISSCVEAVSDAVTHARFVGTDASGDGVVLMRILQVLRALVLSPIGDHLSDESICEIMLSCFRICFETRLSELLRRTAEHCLRDMVHHLFVRLPQFADDTRVLPNMKKMRANGIENTRPKRKVSKNLKQKVKPANDDLEDDAKDLLSPVERVRGNHLATTPITPAGNIVDMQGSLDHGTPDKIDDDKAKETNSDNKTVEKNSDVKNGEENGDKVEENVKTDGEINKSDEEIGSPDGEAAKTDGETAKTDGEVDKSDESVKKDKENVEINEDNLKESSEKETVKDKESADDKISVSLSKDTIAESPDFIQSPLGSVEDLSVDEKLPKIVIDDNMQEYVNQQGVRFTPLQQLTPYGALCIRELFRFLVTLCNPSDKQNTEMMTHVGLSLLQVALEISADALANFPSLLAVVKDELSRNLIVLLSTERLSILAADLQVAFLLFESQREHLKFQLEHYLLKLMEIIDSESNRITYEQRELALEAITRLWRIPGLPAEMYINYDCGLYSSNLYEELMKLLSKNASALMGSMHSIQFVALDAIIMLVAGIEARCKGYKDLYKPARHDPSPSLPTIDDLKVAKTNKRWLAHGTEKFNEHPRTGIAKLAEHGLLGPGDPDPERIAKLLRENPMLDKLAIAEYISRKENTNILNAFVKSLDLGNMRVDQALRFYLESFRLPGEAPLISHLLEKFAEHWHDSNGRPFASADAAFTLAYAVIMLNVDQHNRVATRQNNPMTAEQFKKNVKNCNGGADFDQDMLDEIYNSIKSQEIVMPAEQTGLVKENYLWKVLLRRGESPESFYMKVGNGGAFIDKELAERAWAPIISALCRAYDKAPDRALQRRVAQTFLWCAAISAHYSMTSDLDTLIVSLCKFTGLATGGEPEQVILHFGGSGRCQLAARTLFKITHLHGDGLRASWKNIIDCMQTLYKARLLPKSMTDGEDFLDPTGKVSLLREPATPKPQPAGQGILSSLYSYIALDTRVPHPAEATAKKRASDCIANCYLKQILEESKFLQESSLRPLVGALVSVNSHDEDIAVFLLELLLEVTIQNRDRVMCIWPIVLAHMDGLLTTAARENHPYLLERVAVGMLRLAIRLLRGEEFAYTVLPPLMPLTHLASATTAPLARQIAYGLFELLKTGAANIHTSEDWKVVFSLLECSGAGALSPKPTTNEESLLQRSVLDQRPVSPVPEWVLVSPTGTEAPLPVAADSIVLDRDFLPHDPVALIKCCESLTFLVRDVAHVTPFNFELCIQCIRTFVEAVLQIPTKRVKLNPAAFENEAYHATPIQLLELMHTLHARTAQVFRWWAEESGTTEAVSLWPAAWRPLLQGIARLCCDSRRGVRAAAITYLQSTLLAADLNQLTAVEWSQCLEQVLFPLLAQLLNPIAAHDPSGIEETRVRAAMLLSKVFLHHLTPLLTLPGFLPLWLTVLDLLRSYMHVDHSELLFEAIPESLKNMLLVMSSTGVLTPTSNLWEPTWRTINGFLPNLKSELFPDPPIPAPAEEISNTEVISLVEQEQPSFPIEGSIAVQPDNQPDSLSQPANNIPVGIPLVVPPLAEADNACQSPNRTSVLLATDYYRVAGQDFGLPTLGVEAKEQQQVINLLNQPPPSVASPVAIQPTSQSFDFYQPRVIDDKAETKGLEEQAEEGRVEQQDVAGLEGSFSPTHQLTAHKSSPLVTTTMFNSAAYFSEDPAADRLFVVTNP
ncbi:Golgi-specific brefeldin A-resistance guanine nucleotide exchange factor 1 isoform X1 [Microplitis demolitor]|uniref:Golgi-specific brefeldin A-resistance guanine nucleotide exchange factor 1 isoform X1 n=1 Tax=Microplitis demolitor TaxID=69319 RepID=UPI0004CD3FB0|nr:Golgi-specific brefeldin A-resistance guanine nucleotide exchange factor 1 isoform X1 [Microplitis demolitor]XP_008550801.1 Golgi-specific brefeldin A-resistance guanine nucleotide exchange factor 1 isoform X1 [Microplitis demolitor]